MEFLKAHQLNIMMFMSGICGILALLALLTKALPPRRRRILALLEASAMLLLLFDRFAYLHRGDPSELGFWMVRISNFMVYFMTLFTLHAITLYLYDLFVTDGLVAALPRRLMLCELLFAAGVVLLVVSQFTGLYYTFDARNTYQRSPANLLCYAAPMLITLLQQSMVIQYRKRLNHHIAFALLLNTFVPFVASIVQAFVYGVSLTNMTMVGVAAVLYVYTLLDLSDTVESARQREIERYREDEKNHRALFEQTAEALANAIDAKDTYTRGHSARVALYSSQIAKEAGMSQEDCEKVYFAALLHDVGKIGIADDIINKNGKLTDEEYAQIKLHPVFGNQILSSIQQSPYLSIGAHHHHERYDGKGYPDGLKGEDIPEIARIIAVADAYDAMTSRRSYRDTIPQQKVREQLLMGMGTQFDPTFAKIMLHLIDSDIEYRMQESEDGSDVGVNARLHCDRVYEDCTVGILLTRRMTRIRLYSEPLEGFPARESIPSLILFDALDARVHDEEDKVRDLLYFEYALLRFDGKAECKGARKLQVDVKKREDAQPAGGAGRVRYDIEAVRRKDHALIRVMGPEETVEFIVALPDNSRFAHISLTGDHCLISGIHIEQDENPIGEGYIPRIAEEVSYIKGCPEGDVPNVEVDGWRTDSTEGIRIAGDTRIRFHTRSFPTARLVWHCPYVSIFTSANGRADGRDFREFVLIRLDGENWESDAHAENDTRIARTKDFPGWREWKEIHKQGLDCEVEIRREGNKITVSTVNLGISISSVTIIKDRVSDVYAALTGDQVALTDIRVLPGKEKQTA